MDMSDGDLISQINSMSYKEKEEFLHEFREQSQNTFLNTFTQTLVNECIAKVCKKKIGDT
jgi:hypothetical protein